jgi:hypothetical protein
LFTGNTRSRLRATSSSRDLITSDAADEDELIECRVREGNLRQRRYRLDKVSQWLLGTFTKEATTSLRKKK